MNASRTTASVSNPPRSPRRSNPRRGRTRNVPSIPPGAVRRPRYVGRPAAAATATGLMSKHQAQLKAFLDDAFSA